MVAISQRLSIRMSRYSRNRDSRGQAVFSITVTGAAAGAGSEGCQRAFMGFTFSCCEETKALTGARCRGQVDDLGGRQNQADHAVPGDQRHAVDVHHVARQQLEAVGQRQRHRVLRVEVEDLLHVDVVGRIAHHVDLAGVGRGRSGPPASPSASFRLRRPLLRICSADGARLRPSRRPGCRRGCRRSPRRRCAAGCCCRRRPAPGASAGRPPSTRRRG
jgi:hypothetical protein